MKTALKNLLKELEDVLIDINISGQNTLVRSAEAMKRVEETLHLISGKIISEGFSSREEEMDYFKNIAPPLYAKLIYFQKLYHLEIHLIHADHTYRKKILQRTLKKITYFFQANATLLSYHASGSNLNDPLYFLRENQQLLHIRDDFAFLVDSRTCTIASYVIAKMIAYKKLEEYVSLQILAPAPRTATAESPGANHHLHWTASKISATELVYGLFSSGIFNNGQAKLKEIIFAFEQCFQIDLSGYQSTYQDMKMRKKSRTAFLSDLRQKLESKMDDEED